MDGINKSPSDPFFGFDVVLMPGEWFIDKLLTNGSQANCVLDRANGNLYMTESLRDELHCNGITVSQLSLMMFIKGIKQDLIPFSM